MKIHFSWTISANSLMELESKIMVASTKGMNCHNTVWVQKKEYDKVDPSLKKMVDIQTYEPNSALLEPWATTPKWDVEPQGDVIIGTDADVMVWNQELAIKTAEECLETNKLYGTIGYAAPFPKSEWETLFDRYKMRDEFKYQYTNTKEPSPYYINNGVVMMTKETLPHFRSSYNKWLAEINKWHYKCYYLCQVANTMAINELQIPVVAMPRTFNYTEVDNPGTPLLEEAIFLHYNTTREDIAKGGINAIKNLTIKNKIYDLMYGKIKMI